MSNPDAVHRKLIGTKGGRRRLSTLLALRDAQKRDTKLGNPTREEMRECIKSQWCWWCDSGPWKCLAAHTSKAHGIYATDIRELAYLFKSSSICSPEHSANARARFVEMDSRGVIKRVNNAHHTTHIMSTAGHDVAAACLKKTRNSPAFLEGEYKYHEAIKGKHPCPICGKMIPTSRPTYCSTECSKKNLSIVQSHPNPKLSATLKGLYAKGKLKRDPKKQSELSKEYWRKFKELPIEEQRVLNLKKAESRIVRVVKKCVICDREYNVIPSQADDSVTCGQKSCQTENRRIKATGRKHTPEAIAKMSARAKKRHLTEPLFGTKRESPR